MKNRFDTSLNKSLSSAAEQTSEDRAEVDKVTEAGTVPDKVGLSVANLVSVAAALVEDGSLVEYSTLRQGHVAGLTMLGRIWRIYLPLSSYYLHLTLTNFLSS